MQTLTSIYQTLDQNQEYSRDLHKYGDTCHFTPWNSLDVKSTPKKKSKILIRDINSFLKTSRVKSYSQTNTPSRKRQSIKRTSYQFETQINLPKDLLSAKRYSSDSGDFIDKLPQLSARGEKRIKIKSFNDQVQLKKYATINKLSIIDQQTVPSSFKTMFLTKHRNGVQLRNKNIQMIRHISQRKMGIL